MGEVVNTIRRSATEFWDHKVMNSDLFGVALRTPLAPRILKLTHQLLFLGVDRNYRLPAPLVGFDLLINVLKLSVTIRMASLLQHLLIGLQTVTQLMQQFGNQRVIAAVPHPFEFIGQLPDTFTGPPQW